MDYLERGLGSQEKGNNLLDKLQDAIGRGQNPMSILPLLSTDPEIITIYDPDEGKPGNLRTIGTVVQITHALIDEKGFCHA